MDDIHKEGWRSMGRAAARRGTSLKTILTNNPDLDILIREGYQEGSQPKTTTKPRSPFSVDLFGDKIR